MEIIRDVEQFGKRPYPVVALGNFDGVHLGHRAILEAAISHAAALGGSAYALTFDPLPAKVLSPHRAPSLIVTAEDKLELFAACGLSGAIVLNFTLELSRISPRDFVRHYLLGKIGAHEVVVGHNVSFGHQRAGNSATLVELGRELGFKATVVGPVTIRDGEVSSTRIRELISHGDLKTAAVLLGRHHFLSGTVVRGRERGRTIGFPTANLDCDTECMPPDGVYATRLVLDGKPYPSVTNIGMRPTFNEQARSVESHIFDFDRDIYGARVKLELVDRLRGEQKFASADALARQISEDLNRARQILASA